MTDPINIMQAASDEWCEGFDGFDSSRSHFVAIKKGLEKAGYAIVPVEPTDAMWRVGYDTCALPYHNEEYRCSHTYKAMIKAAQEGE